MTTDLPVAGLTYRVAEFALLIMLVAGNCCPFAIASVIGSAVHPRCCIWLVIFEADLLAPIRHAGARTADSPALSTRAPMLAPLLAVCAADFTPFTEVKALDATPPRPPLPRLLWEQCRPETG